MYPSYLITILDDLFSGDSPETPRRRVLATRRVFKSEAEAEEAARIYPPSRHAKVLPCPFPLADNIRP